MPGPPSGKEEVQAINKEVLMLVLTREKGERILIGDNIILQVIEVRRDGRVRLGFDAPREIQIVREELITPDYPKGWNP